MTARIPYPAFIVLMAVYAVFVFYGLVRSVINDHLVLAVVFALLASPVPMALTRLFIEDGSVRDMFDVRLQSWTFIFGDIFALPFAAAMATLGWRSLDKVGGHWYTGHIWLVVAAFIGVLAGIAFHVNDSAAYRAAGAEVSLNSPTKLLHDFVAYPALFGAIVCVGVPLLISSIDLSFPYVHIDVQPYAYLMLVGLVSWFAFGILDGSVHKPQPANMHPNDFVWP